MRLAFAAALLVSSMVGCDGSVRLPGSATAPPTVYSATLSASSACEGKIPAGEAVRVYEVTASGGVLQWRAPTITQSGADQRSSLKVDGDTVSLVIGSGWPEPQDDVFYGIWEDLGTAGTLAIYGHGRGRFEGPAMTGTFEGNFDAGASHVPGTTCHAANHHFTFVAR